MLYIFVPYINIKTYCSYFLNAKSLFTLILCSNFMDNEYALLHTDSVLMKCLVHLQRYPLLIGISCFHSPQFSHSVVSNSLRPHESQHARPPCPSQPTPGVHWDSRPSSQWCHPAISSSVVPSSSCPQSLPASESFPMSQLFTWGGQSTGVSALASFPPKKSRADLLQNELVGSPCSPRDSQESSPTPQFKSINSLALSFLHSPTLTSIHDHWKNHSLD